MIIEHKGDLALHVKKPLASMSERLGGKHVKRDGAWGKSKP